MHVLITVVIRRRRYSALLNVKTKLIRSRMNRSICVGYGRKSCEFFVGSLLGGWRGIPAPEESWRKDSPSGAGISSARNGRPGARQAAENGQNKDAALAAERMQASENKFPQGLNPSIQSCSVCGTTKVVPFQNPAFTRAAHSATTFPCLR